jgi:hypothetical protein
LTPVKPTDKNLYTSWDTSEIIENQVKFLKEQQEEEVKAGTRDAVDSDDELANRVSEDSDLFQMEWNDMTDSITELMKTVGKRAYSDDLWVADVENFGWRSLSGTTGVFKAATGRELLIKVLPDTECTFKVFKVGKEIRLQNWHHDSPIGNEWYTIRPATAKEAKEAGY